jgi:chemotaxis protein CheY-P-specific phosphatase CheC
MSVDWSQAAGGACAQALSSLFGESVHVERTDLSTAAPAGDHHQDPWTWSCCAVSGALAGDVGLWCSATAARALANRLSPRLGAESVLPEIANIVASAALTSVGNATGVRGWPDPPRYHHGQRDELVKEVSRCVWFRVVGLPAEAWLAVPLTSDPQA